MGNFIYTNHQITDYLKEENPFQDMQQVLSLRLLFENYMAYLVKKMKAYDEANQSDKKIHEEVPYSFLLWQLKFSIDFFIQKMDKNNAALDFDKRVNAQQLKDFESIFLNARNALHAELYENVLTDVQDHARYNLIKFLVMLSIVTAVVFSVCMYFIATATTGGGQVGLIFMDCFIALWVMGDAKSKWINESNKKSEVDPVYTTIKAEYSFTDDYDGGYWERIGDAKWYKLDENHHSSSMFKEKKKSLNRELEQVYSSTNRSFNILCRDTKNAVLPASGIPLARDFNTDVDGLVRGIVKTLCCAQYKGVYSGNYYEQTSKKIGIISANGLVGNGDDALPEGLLYKNMKHESMIDIKKIKLE